MMDCRNCGSTDLVELGFIGRIAPFFLKRVFNIEMHLPLSVRPAKRLIQALLWPLKTPLTKIYSKLAYVEMQSCQRCSFVQATHPFPEEWITRLYLDYRSDTYNRERIHYEPSYAAIASRVGVSGLEVTRRLDAATRFLAGKLETSEAFTMLDYGGADGRFLPALAKRRYVYEISDVAPIAGVERIASEAALGQYSYVHLAHVLEHVVYPLKLVQQVVHLIEPRGYLYIEVPQEVDDRNLKLFQQGKVEIELSIHEHINGFSTASLTQLMKQAGLDLIAIEAEVMDVGWAKATHLRALGRKP